MKPVEPILGLNRSMATTTSCRGWSRKTWPEPERHDGGWPRPGGLEGESLNHGGGRDSSRQWRARECEPMN